MSTPESVSAWDEAMENSLIEQKPTEYALATTTVASSQRLQDFSWESVKSEPVPGLQLAELYSIDILLLSAAMLNCV